MWLTDGRASWGVEVSTLRSAAPSGTQSAWHASSCWVVGEIYVGGAGVCPRLFKPVRSSQRNVSLSIPLYLTALELTNLLACIKRGIWAAGSKTAPSGHWREVGVTRNLGVMFSPLESAGIIPTQFATVPLVCVRTQYGHETRRLTKDFLFRCKLLRTRRFRNRRSAAKAAYWLY